MKNNSTKIIALYNKLSHDQTVYLILLTLNMLFYCNSKSKATSTNKVQRIRRVSSFSNIMKKF